MCPAACPGKPQCRETIRRRHAPRWWVRLRDIDPRAGPSSACLGRGPDLDIASTPCSAPPAAPMARQFRWAERLPARGRQGVRVPPADDFRVDLVRQLPRPHLTGGGGTVVPTASKATPCGGRPHRGAQIDRRPLGATGAATRAGQTARVTPWCQRLGRPHLGAQAHGRTLGTREGGQTWSEALSRSASGPDSWPCSISLRRLATPWVQPLATFGVRPDRPTKAPRIEPLPGIEESCLDSALLDPDSDWTATARAVPLVRGPRPIAVDAAIRLAAPPANRKPGTLRGCSRHAACPSWVVSPTPELKINDVIGIAHAVVAIGWNGTDSEKRPVANPPVMRESPSLLFWRSSVDATHHEESP